MSGIKGYSTTATSNNAAPPNGWPENMLASKVNDTGRQMMADIRSDYENREWRDWGHTVTYATATTFTVATDVTSTYTVNRPIRCTDATTLYGYVASSSYSAPNTTVTVTLDSGSLSASLTAVALGNEPTHKNIDVTAVRNAATQSGNNTWSGTSTVTGLLGGKISERIQSIDASVASNALTLTLNPTILDFRSSTLASGTVNTRTVSAAISVVISSGSTLGTVNATAARIAVLAIDNAGTVELAAVNLAGGNNLDETTLISTTAEGGAGAADSASTIYSTTARTNVPFRVVGFVDVTEATAGTWATAPSTIQGAGGNAYMALGSGRTWQDVGASRAIGTTYYNTTGRDISISIWDRNATNAGGCWSATVNGNVVCLSNQPYTAGSIQKIEFDVPAGGSYLISQETNTNTFAHWFELR